MSNWISVEDELPDNNEMVIVFSNDIINAFVETAYYYTCPEYLTGNWCDENGDDYPPITTHWMPLPPPPEQAK